MNKLVYFKYSPLIDPIKYMTGRYDSSYNLFELPNFDNYIKNDNSEKGTNEENIDEKIKDVNNSAYVDGFFSYLTSQLYNNYNFINGTNFYGAFLGIKNDFKIDIIDEMDYLLESDFFYKNKDILFKIDSLQDYRLNCSSRKNKDKLLIKPHEEILTLNDINELPDFYNDNDNDTNVNNNNSNSELELIEDNLNNLDMDKTSTNKTSSSCSSRTSNTSTSNSNEDEINSNEDESNSNEDESNSNSDFEEYTSSSTSEEQSINAVINMFPVEIICLEKCENTLDSLMLSYELNVDEWSALLFQIIMTLITYQKLFKFTHNDLHTNNIMYILTDNPYIYYKYEFQH
jgi:hypothetical protein